MIVLCFALMFAAVFRRRSLIVVFALWLLFNLEWVPL